MVTVWTWTSTAPLVWNLIRSLLTRTVSSSSAFCVRRLAAWNPSGGGARAAIGATALAVSSRVALGARRWMWFMVGLLGLERRERSARPEVIRPLVWW